MKRQSLLIALSLALFVSMAAAFPFLNPPVKPESITVSAPDYLEITSTVKSTSIQGVQVNVGGGGGGGGGGPLYTLPRVVQTSEGISGTVNQGNFEPFTLAFDQSIVKDGGYITDSNLMLNNNTWNGSWSVNIPTSNTTSFLFATKDLVNQYGHISSINTKTHDVTAQTNGNKSAVPYTAFAIAVKELNTPNPNQPFYSKALGVLGSSLETVAYVAIIFVPSFGGLLGLLYVSQRVIIPLMKKAAGANSKSPLQEQGGR